MADITFSVPAPGGVTELGGHLATPEGDGPWPGVVVLAEATGLNADIRAQADRLAAAGYLALAPDLYHGRPWLRCVRAAFRDLNRGRGRAFDDIEAARSWLAGRDDCTGRVGVAGFCLGGGFALLAAARYDFQAACVNYGTVPRDAARALDGVCPVVATYGGRDRSLRGAADRLERALTVLGVPHDVREYPDSGHGFLTDSRAPAPLAPIAKVVFALGEGRHNADDGWKRIFAFFGEHLARA
ncbi:MAG TPA: dienelactone hydrolase family protein [Thermomonospora sp.]|nr:dienelactone hydrolase family protein [Thermomonospora sp.]